MKRKIYTLMLAATALTFAACNKTPDEPSTPVVNSIYWRVDPTTLEATPILADCGISNPYSISVFDNLIYLTTDGGYSSNGDVVCFNLSGLKQWQAEAGILPSKVEPYENVNTNLLAYVLNEGLWGGNNASLGSINRYRGYMTNNVFRNANHRSLGDVAQDVVAYGHKAYVSVTFSNTIEVIDTRNDTVIKQIRMGEGSPTASNPRKIVPHGGKIYVSCYDPCSVVRIDTATLQVEAICQLGTYRPEGLGVAGDKLFVASTFQIDEQSVPSYDNKVYVVDLGTFTVDSTITVGLNPTVLKVVDGSHVAVGCVGNYADEKASLVIINANDGSQRRATKALYNFDTDGGFIYGYESTY
ncbi:MAG: hypothetical protein IJ789_01280 [Bacteroidales bacterium]|nr:hypothetical protein [Bacteroidales bacterium]